MIRKAPQKPAWLPLRAPFLAWVVLAAACLPWLAGAQEASPERNDVARFRQRAEAILSEQGAEKGHWGALVTDAETGEVLFALNPAQYFTPASNTKLFTTALALATLGPDFRIRTTVEATGAIDADRPAARRSGAGGPRRRPLESSLPLHQARAARWPAGKSPGGARRPGGRGGA